MSSMCTSVGGAHGVDHWHILELLDALLVALPHMLDIKQIDRQGLDSLNADQLRGLVGQLLDRSGRDAHEIVWRDAKIDKLTFEVAQLKRLQYGKKSEQLDTEQRALFDEAVQADIAAVEEQIAALQASLPPRTEDQKQTPKRAALPAAGSAMIAPRAAAMRLRRMFMVNLL